jgi:hypothetical protein
MRAPMVLALAVLAMAAASVSPATAAAEGETVLCEVNEEECPVEQILGYGFTASANATFNFGGGFSVQCISPMARSESEQMALYFGNCTEEECVVESRNLFYHADLTEPSAGDGTLWIEDGGKGEPQVHFACWGMECLYGNASSELHFDGGEPASLSVHGPLAKKAGGPLCPSGIKWSAAYTVSSPSPVYASHRTVEGPVFCKELEEFCAQKNTVPSLELFLWPELVIGEFLSGSSIVCFESDGSLDNSQPFVPGGLWAFESTDPGTCVSPVFTGCEVSVENTPYHLILEPGEEGDGALWVSEGEKGVPAFGVGCSYLGVPFSCTYASAEFPLEFNGGGEAGPFHASFPLGRVSGSLALCPEVVSLEADYEVSGPPTVGTLYLTES